MYFWTSIADALLDVDHWCVGGYFNMLEDPTDWVGGSHVMVHGTKLAAWERLSGSLMYGTIRLFPTLRVVLASPGLAADPVRGTEFYYHWQASPRTQLGERVTAEFFEITGPRNSHVGIGQLRRQDGTIATEPDELRSIATEF